MKKLLTIFLILAQVWVYSQSKSDYKELQKYIEDAVNKFEVPGLAVGIFKDGEIVFNEGFGLRNSETKEAVTPETQFGIASCSKAFTAACLGILVDEGKIKWTDPVVKHYPKFKMYDPYITSEMQVQDLVCHRSGLQTFDGDLLWYGTNYTREDVVERIQFRENPYSFRSRFGYQNVMFIVAGELIKEVSGQSWDEFVKTKIFEPLHMTATSTTNSHFTTEMNVSAPHLDGKAMPFINYDNSGPAASMNTSVTDMMAWIETWLNKGSYKDNQIFSEDYFYKSTNTMTPLNGGHGDKIGGTHFYGYGLGWFLFDYEGRKVIQHGGGLPGVHSKVVLIPEDNLGYVIIANQISGLVESVYKRILDFYLSDSETDWVEIYYQNEQKSKTRATEKEATREEERVKNTTPSLSSEKYAGMFEDKMYGKAEVAFEDNQLTLTLLPTKELFSSKMEHWHYDTFKFKFNDPFLPAGFVTFNKNQHDEVEGFNIDLENPDFHFYKLDFKKIEISENN